VSAMLTKAATKGPVLNNAKRCPGVVLLKCGRWAANTVKPCT